MSPQASGVPLAPFPVPALGVALGPRRGARWDRAVSQECVWPWGWERDFLSSQAFVSSEEGWAAWTTVSSSRLCHGHLV